MSTLVYEASFGVLEIPGFTLLKPLGEGRAGIVFKVRQDERTCALKVFDPAVFATIRERERSMASLEAARSVEQLHLVPPLEVGCTDPYLWFSEELIEGVSLARMLEVDGALPVDDALAITQGVLEALAALEGGGLVHGNLTLGNVLVDRFGTTRVTDGAIVPSPTDTAPPPLGPSPLSDARFLAPERYLGLELDGRADLFSAGVVLYRLLTGAWPFPEAEGTQLASCHVNEDVPSPKLIAEVPAHASAFVDWLTARDPLKRYPTAASALADLVQLVGGQPLRGPTGRGPEPQFGDTTSGPAFSLGSPLEARGGSIELRSCPFRVRLSSRGQTLSERDFDQDSVLIGRSPNSGIHIDNPIVSRRHAEIRRRGTRFSIAPLSSTNPTAVDGARVHDERELSPGDLVVLSDKFHLEIDWDARVVVVAPPDEDPTPQARARLPLDREVRAAPATQPQGVPSRAAAPATLPQGVPSRAAAPPPDSSSEAAALRGGEPTDPRGFTREQRGADPARSGTWMAPRGYVSFARGGREVRTFISHAFQIGSSHSCDLRLSNDLPRKAALLTRSSDGYRLYNVSAEIDAVSLNSEPLADQAVLEPGDRIEVHGQLLVFDLDDD